MEHPSLDLGKGVAAPPLLIQGCWEPSLTLEQELFAQNPPSCSAVELEDRGLRVLPSGGQNDSILKGGGG